MQQVEVFNRANEYINSENKTDAAFDEVVSGLFTYYRATGYPIYLKESYNVDRYIEKIKSIDEKEFYDSKTKTIKKYQGFNGFLFSYFPHWVSVACGNSASLEDSWNDDKKLRELIEKTLRWEIKHNEHWTNNRIRQNAKIFCSGQSVSNFNPIAAKYLYNRYGNKGVVLDMSCGWGGRMFGFVGSNCKKYIGFDPSSKTYQGLLELSGDINKDNKKEIVLFKSGSEEIKNNHIGNIDFAFTSCPYFDCEKYANEPSQSFIKFPTRESWVNGFLGQTFEGVYDNLKDNGKMAINIANTPKYDWLEEECVNIAEEKGFRLENTLKYEISNVAFGKGNKVEPIFIFKK